MVGWRQDEIPSRIGRYRVTEPLGAGGMGVVYAAYDPHLDREVAVKLLRPDRLDGDPAGAKERLRREAQITARLAHPNVVTIFDVGESEGTVYVAMEKVSGPSLREWCAAEARPWREVLGMFFQAGRGLAAAHEAGLIHCDFKPGNVLVGNGRARVVDFGLALPTAQPPRPVARVRLREDLDLLQTESGTGAVGHLVDPRGDETLTVGGPAREVSVSPPRPAVTDATRELVGTPAYMAPELFQGAPADERSDQFAFCVSLYEGLYGRRPFEGRTAVELAQNVASGRALPPPPRSRVPGWLHNIVAQGLRVEPRERHASMKALLASVVFTLRIMYE